MSTVTYDNEGSFALGYLGKAQIDKRMDELAVKFDPGITAQPHPVNIERFITRHLGLQVQSESLSSDLSVLGVYAAGDSRITAISGTREENAISVGRDTILIEKRLYAPGHANRRRLILAHEAGHAILHRDYLSERAKGEKGQSAFVSCTRHALKQHHLSELSEGSEMDDLMEYQANCAADALLMPVSAVRVLFNSGRHLSKGREVEEAIILTAATFRVTEKAARRRLKELGYLQKPREFSISVFGQKLASACMF